MDHPARRRERLARIVADEKLDGGLFTSPVSVTYLTGFSGDSSVLLLGGDQAVLVSDMRYTEQIAEECPGLDTVIRAPTRKLSDAVADTVKRLGWTTVGFESAAMTVSDLDAYREALPSVNFKGGTERVEKLRMVKDESEVAAIREAIGIAERAFDAFRSLLRADDREKDLSDAMDAYVRRAGGTATAFPSIIAVGARSALPHAPPTSHRIGGGELLLIDWGACGRFYKSDLTRTVGVRSISTKLREIYEVVLGAQQAAMNAVRPGVVARDVDAAARGFIEAAGYGPYFGHGLGHGIGLQIHEGPAIRPHSETVLEAGMVFTIEPGIYLPGWGGVRIEDDVLVTPDGCEVLTHVSRELTALEFPD
jgi:Xaa-Pro aminopeptidase